MPPKKSATKIIGMRGFLTAAVNIANRQREIAQSIRDFRAELTTLEKEYSKIEDFILKNIKLYYCESCKRWLPKKDMTRIDDDRPITGNNGCRKCGEEKYFEHLAKAVINQAGISLLDAPSELLEIEIIRAKTRNILKLKNKQNGNIGQQFA